MNSERLCMIDVVENGWIVTEVDRGPHGSVSWLCTTWDEVVQRVFEACHKGVGCSEPRRPR